MGPFALHDEFGAVVENQVGFVVFGSKPRVRNLAEFVMMSVQPGFEGGRLLVCQFAGIRGYWFHDSRYWRSANQTHAQFVKQCNCCARDGKRPGFLIEFSPHDAIAQAGGGLRKRRLEAWEAWESAILIVAASIR